MKFRIQNISNPLSFNLNNVQRSISYVFAFVMFRSHRRRESFILKSREISTCSSSMKHADIRDVSDESEMR